MKKVWIGVGCATLCFIACKSTKQTLEFAVPEADQRIVKGESFQLKLKFGSVTMDSVAYYVDNKRVGAKTDTTAVSVDSKNLTFGTQQVAALVYHAGKVDSANSTIYIVPDAAKSYGFEVVNKFPHDTAAFTQGLQYADGILYESCGRYGYSNIRKVDLTSGKVIKQVDLDSADFAEGLTLAGNKLFLLTWQQLEGYIYDKNSFTREGVFKYKNSKEGWGVTYDGTRLIKSDGSAKLYFLDAKSGEELDSIHVYDENGPVDSLNELEYIDGLVYANVYQKEIIVMIDPKTGAVVGKINLIGLYEHTAAYDNELNGIAYDHSKKRLFVTGKLWNALYEIKLVAQ